MTDTRSVIDYYKYWTVDAIRADLDTKRHDFSVLLSNQVNDFNLGTAIRNANAFLCKEVIIYGRRKYDKRGAVGTFNYEHLRYVKYVEDLNFSSDIFIVGVDNIQGAEPIESFAWPSGPVVMAFGQEQTGLSDEIISLCHKLVYIKQYGSTRSLNLGVASGIAMYDYCSKMHK